MQENKRIAFLIYIDDLLKATSAGKMVWKSVNPTTFVWEAASGTAKLSFQRVERSSAASEFLRALQSTKPVSPAPKQIFYLFQAFSTDQQSTPILTLDSTEEPELNEKFDALFDLIKTGISERSLEFLRSILPK